VNGGSFGCRFFVGKADWRKCKKSEIIVSEIPLKWLVSAKKTRWLGQIQPNHREFLALVMKN